jgi:uncharacterized membrane protein
VEARVQRIIWAVTVLFAVWMLYLEFSLHRRFGTQTFDMAIFDQGIWLLSEFREPFVTIRGLNLFADHTSYVLILFAPLYWIVEDVHILMIVSVTALAIGGPLTYAIARESGLRTHLSAALAFVYFLHPAVAWNVWDIFHPEVLAVPLLLGAYLLVLRNRWAWAVTLLVLTLLVKEDAAVVVVPLGIFLAWRFKRVKEGLGIAAFGSALLAFNMFYVLPAFSPTGGLTNNWRYTQFGDGVWGAAKGMVTQPKLLFSELFGSERLKYYAQLVGPIPTALLAPEILLVAVPVTAANALSFHVHQYEIRFHYTVYMLAIGTIAAVSGAVRLKEWLGERSGYVAAVVLVAALAGSALVSPWTILREGDPWVGAAQNHAPVDEAIAMIPEDAPVAADWFTTTHLAQRVEIYMLPNPVRNRYYGAGERYAPTLDDVDWLVAQRWALNDKDVTAAFDAARRGGEFETVVDNATLLVMKRIGAPTR